MFTEPKAVDSLSYFVLSEFVREKLHTDPECGADPQWDLFPVVGADLFMQPEKTLRVRLMRECLEEYFLIDDDDLQDTERFDEPLERVDCMGLHPSNKFEFLRVFAENLFPDQAALPNPSGYADLCRGRTNRVLALLHGPTPRRLEWLGLSESKKFMAAYDHWWARRRLLDRGLTPSQLLNVCALVG